MAWYRTGSVSITKGATSVTGVGTRWASNARVGDAFRGPDGEWYEIVNIADETTLGILPAYQGATVSNNSVYTIAPMQGYVKESADRLRQITNGIEDVSGNVEKAAASASAAKTSETNAASSASKAATSATAAGTSATNTKTSETNSKTSETNAKASETAANTSKNAAATSATNASGSASDASSSATAAAGSASAAATSNTNSGNSATASRNSATAAATSATNAKTSETNAKTSETNASSSASAAKTSETNAKTSETNSASSASAANTSKNAAATSATNASASETKAKAWAINPENSAVETNAYSALHWAAKAKASAEKAESVNGPRLTSIAAAVLSVNDMLIADSTTTMAKIATGTMGRAVLAANNNQQARDALGLGPASNYDVVTSMYGQSVGQGLGNLLMRQGYFGLGSTDLLDLANGTDLNTVNATGFYQVNGGANTNSPLNSLAGQMMVMTNATSHITQLFSPQDKSSRLFTRSSVKTSNTDNTPDFGPWSQIVMAGDYGLGSTGYLAYMTGSVDDYTRANGTYSVSSSNAGTKPTGQSFGILEVLGRNNIEGSGSRVVQIWHVTDGQAPSQMWIRHVSTSTPFAWTDWREMAGIDSITSALAGVGLGLTQAANAIPASADLNNYMTTGMYGQSQNAQASNGTNYPVAKAGSLLVQNGGSAITTQQYMEYDTGNMWTRARYNSNWTAWKFQVTNEYFDNFKSTYGIGTSVVAKVDDANNVTESGEYFVLASSSTNIPVQSNGTLKHESWSGTSAAKQTYTQLSNTSARTWIRSKASGSWSAWFELATSGISNSITDLNSLRGTYSFGFTSAATGSPVRSGGYDAVGWQTEGLGQRTQFAILSTSDIVCRTDDSANASGEWSDWIGIANTSQIDSLTSIVATKANLASPLFTGTPAAPTPSLTDNGDRLATTKFVQQSKRNYTGNVVGVSESVTLTPAQSGFAFHITATGVTITLPAGGNAGSGATYNFRNVSTGPATITVPSGGIFSTANSSSSSLVLLPGEWCELAASTGNYFMNGRGILQPTATTIAPTFAGTVTVTGTDAVRYVNTDATYGLVSRMDSGAFYMLLTDSGSPYGSFNSLRPFYINLQSGLVTMAQGASTSAPAASDRSSRIVNSSWVGSQLDSKEPTISAGSTTQFWRGDKTWQDFGTMTRGQSLASVNVSLSGTIVANDSILTAFGKTQAQLNAITGDNQNITSLRATKYIDKIFVGNASGAPYNCNIANQTVFELTLTGNTTLAITGTPTLNSNELITVVITIKQGSTARALTLPSGTRIIAPGGTIAAPAANKQQDYIFTLKAGDSAWEVRAGAFT